MRGGGAESPAQTFATIEQLRRVVYAVVAIALIVIVGVSVGWYVVGRESTQRATDIQESRKIATGVMCAFGSALADAGRATISGGDIQPPVFARNLERLGLPPKSVRVAGAKTAGAAYVTAIVAAVEQQTGIKGFVRKDGTLDCAKLQRATVAGGATSRRSVKRAAAARRAVKP